MKSENEKRVSDLSIELIVKSTKDSKAKYSVQYGHNYIGNSSNLEVIFFGKENRNNFISFYPFDDDETFSKKEDLVLDLIQDEKLVERFVKREILI